MKTKLLLVCNVLLIAAFVLSACGGAATPVPAPAAPAQPAAPAAPATEPTKAPAAPAAPVKITIWHQWQGEYLTAIEAAFKDYSAAHPNVTIDLSKPEDVNNALKVAVPAGEGPDIIGWANDNIGAQALAGNIVALNDLGIDQKFLESTYEPAAIKGVVWQDKIWALPESQEGIALVYNKDLVTDEYLPKDPLNFEDFLAKAKAFKDKTGKVLVCSSGLGGADAYHVAPIYFGFGVPEYVDDQGKAYLGAPEAVAAGKWLVELSKVSLKEANDDICKADFAEGKVGIRWTGPWAIKGIEDAKVNYGLLPMGRPFVGIKTLMLTKNAVDRGSAEVALDIIKYFTGAEVQKKLALINKTIPAATAAVKDPEVQKLATLAGFGAALNLGVPMANTPYAGAQWQPVADATLALWNGTQAPDVALAAAQKAIDEAIAKMK